MADIINHEQNGFKSDLGKIDSPSGKSVWHPEAGDDLNGSRSQRRHFNNFNKSTVFDFLKGPSDGEKTNEVDEVKSEDDEVKSQVVAMEEKRDEIGGEKNEVGEVGKKAMEHKQKRHFNYRNRSSFDM